MFHSQVSPSMGINEASFLIRVSDPAKLDFEAVRTVNMTLVARYILLSILQSEHCQTSLTCLLGRWCLGAGRPGWGSRCISGT